MQDRVKNLRDDLIILLRKYGYDGFVGSFYEKRPEEFHTFSVTKPGIDIKPFAKLSFILNSSITEITGATEIDHEEGFTMVPE